MRIAIVLLLVGFLQTHANDAYAQKTRLSVSFTNTQLAKVLDQIENESEFFFLYNEKLIDANRKVTIDAKDELIDEVLKALFAGTDVEYTITDRKIILAPANMAESQQTGKKISGKVTDASGTSLPGVSVSVKGTTTGVITDNSGNYTISSTENAKLQFSFVGMKSQEIAVGGKTIINVTLVEETLGIDEVVVTGYTTQRKKDITGAVAVVDPKAMKSIPSGSAAVALQGQASGVNIISNGAPGSASQIFIRGIGSFGDTRPLVLVDGVESNLDNINTNEIESMQILKDAGSAAIYGVRGSNGVVIVTTKKGKSGTPVVTYDAYYGIQIPLSGNPLNMTNTDDWAKLWTTAYPTEGSFTNGVPDYMYRAPGQPAKWANEGDPAVDPSKYNFDAADPNKNYIIAKVNKAGTNWYQEVFNPAPTTNHNLSVSGGTDKSRYLLALNYMDQQGTLMETFQKRYSARINSDFNIGKHIRIGENISLFSTSGIWYYNVAEDNAVSQSLRTNPLIPVYDIQGHFAGSFSMPIQGNFLNPVATQKEMVNDRHNEWEMRGNAYVEVDFLKHFTLRTSLGGSITNKYGVDFTSNHYYDNQDYAGMNSFMESSGYDLYTIWNNTINYSNTMGKHKLAVFAGSEAIEYSGRGVGGSRSDFYSSDFDYLLLQNGKTRIDNNSSSYITRLFSLFSRIDYSYSDKYLLGLTVRRDGSSKFGAENRYGLFPSVSLGWRLSGEPFMTNIHWLNDMKIRASYGILGSQSNINNANAFTLYDSDPRSSYYDIAGVNNGAQLGFYQSRIGNSNTSWEKDIVLNIGLDASILNNKIDFSAEYYKKAINGLLFSLPLLATAGGAAAPSVNIGDIQNTGLDISAKYRDHIGKDLNFTIGANITSYKNKVMSIPGSAGYFDGASTRIGYLCRNQQGHSVSEFFGYDVIGIFQSADDVANSPVQQQAGPGQFKYRDVNGAVYGDGMPDGKIDVNDRTFIGDPNPAFTYGINIGLNYKRFDLSTVFYGSQGNEVYNHTKWYTYFTSWYHNGLNNDLLNAWSTDNTNSTVPVFMGSTSFSENAVPNSWYIEDGSFLKCRSLILGYTLSPSVLEKLRLRNLRIYFQTTNLFQISKYSGLDPELGGSSSNFGWDFGNYPNNEKSFIIGINLSF